MTEETLEGVISEAMLDDLASDLGIESTVLRKHPFFRVLKGRVLLTYPLRVLNTTGLVDLVWDEATAGHVTAATFGKLLADMVTSLAALPTAQNFTIAAADALLASHDAEVSETAGGPTKKLEFLIMITGVYRITLEVKNSTDANQANAFIYKNGVDQTGELESESPFNQYFLHSNDLYFEEGDLCQLYITAVTNTATVKEFRIKGVLSTAAVAELSV